MKCGQKEIKTEKCKTVKIGIETSIFRTGLNV